MEVRVTRGREVIAKVQMSGNGEPKHSGSHGQTKEMQKHFKGRLTRI